MKHTAFALLWGLFFGIGGFWLISAHFAQAQSGQMGNEIRFVATDERHGVTHGYLLAKIDGKWVSVIAGAEKSIMPAQ